MTENPVYGVRIVDGEPIELCSDCGFDGRRLPSTLAIDALRGLGATWGELLDRDEDLVRARPGPSTWCAVEYATHLRDIVAGNHLVAQFFLDEVDPTLRLPPSDDSADLGPDTCRDVDIDVVLGELASVAGAFADFVDGLSGDELARPGTVFEVRGDILGAARHALHDSTHHVLDVNRGFARMLLDRNPPST